MTPPSADSRRHWRETRERLERRLRESGVRSTVLGDRNPHLLASDWVLDVIRLAFRLTGLRSRALANAQAWRVERVDLSFPDLPQALDGYAILHLSDLHVGTVAGAEARLSRLIAPLTCDLAVITGDTQSYGLPAAEETTFRMAPILSALRPPDGVTAVLGNHDAASLVDAMESRGIRVLVNESAVIEKDGARLVLTGTDDVHAFHTPAAERALADAPDGFRVALIHSPEFADIAARHGHRLYLCGHTHGGQICLPGGRPMSSAVVRMRHLASGTWSMDAMVGRTSRGTGSGTPAFRLNCPPEIALIRLRRASGDAPA